MLSRILTRLKKSWKMGTVITGAVSYGSYRGYNQFEINKAMKLYCEEAASYGEMIETRGMPKRVLVVLNPAAFNKKSEKYFKKYCEPLLHLAGYMVDIVRTDSEGHAKKIIESMKTLPDGIVIAGGDGTISESVTGLMRRNSAKCPIAILPIGNNNQIAKKYFNMDPKNHVDRVKLLGKAALSVVRENLEEKDVIKFVPISDLNEESNEKPTYALGSFQWGAFRDSDAKIQKYWYYGSLRKHACILLNAFNKDLSWECKADILYTPPCAGCQNCVSIRDNTTGRRWWSRLFGLNRNIMNVDYSKIVNKDCSNEKPIQILSSNISISTNRENEQAKLVLDTVDVMENSWEFIRKSFAKLNKHQEMNSKSTEARTITLMPDASCQGENKFCSIDNEEYEVLPLKISVIPRAIKVYI